MKYNPSIAFDEMSGSAKGVTAAKTRGRKYIRNRGYGGSTRTAFQSSVKAVFKQLSQAWQGLTNEQILAWNAAAGTPQGNGITRAYSKAAAFDDPSTPVATAVDIKAKYDAKCGTPSAGSPKVFLKYFFVNTVTGEKSGDVLAQAKLTNE